MTIIRIMLFTGMLFHKAVWELLKRKDSAPVEARERPSFGLKSLVKLFKSLVLVFLIVQTLFLRVMPISKRPYPLRILGLIVYFVGLATAVVGRLQLGDNWVNLEDYQVVQEQSLVSQGIYKFIRHPIYAGDILLILGLELTLNSWLFLGSVPLTLFVINQARSEEAVLSQAFPDYTEYKQRTKMLFPCIL
ncbi:MAG: isoprenylcysteine carboxylmethyltransferase family protein [Chloroflexi bacterium]|nr:isoprenylcysteine carboxylmethyltransferase family protein [Chloroflexota bacterium]